MLSDKAYARYFGQSLLEEILHLDEELIQAVANKQDLAIEEELERSLEGALLDADDVAKNILEEVQKPKVNIKSEYEKELDIMMETALEDKKPIVNWDRANKAAAEFLAGKRKGIPGMRVAKAKDLGLRTKDIRTEAASLSPGKKTKSKGPSCPDCGAGVKHLSFHPFDFGQSSETGYHDAGERYHCHKCNSKGDSEDIR